MPAQILIEGAKPLTTSGEIEVTKSMLPATLQANGLGATEIVKVLSSDGIAEFATGAFTMTGAFFTFDRVTIGGKVYTFFDTPSVPTGDGSINAFGGIDETLQNFLNAINLGPGRGSAYGISTTLNPDVTAISNVGFVLTVEAKIAGSGGNSITTTTTTPAGSWANPTLTGGEDETIVPVLIGSTLFQLQGTVNTRLAINFPLRFKVEKAITVGDVGVSIAYNNQV